MRCWILLALAACDRTGTGDSPTDSDALPATDSAAPTHDQDLDGWPWPEDCDDTDPDVNPGATEICDDLDNDCDGTTDGEDAVDRQTAYVDADGDGHGDGDRPVLVCRVGWGQSALGDDCDDFNSSNHPDNDEACDGLDNDCDTATDEGLAFSDWTLDADGDGYGGDAPSVWACAAPVDHVTATGDCDDTTAAASPGGTEACGDGLDNDCDGTDNGCTPVGTASLTGAWLTIRGGAAGDALGYGVAPAGDLDGDGLADLWLGATGATSGGDETGAAVLLSAVGPGTLDAGVDGTAWLRGTADGDGVGRALAHGDVDGDGLPDGLAGAWGHDGAGNDAGALLIRRGPLSGSGAADLTLTGPTTGSYFGWAVAAGDVDGDGVDDVLVGGPTDNGATTRAGAAWLFYGPITTDLGSRDADATFYGQDADDQAGAYVAMVDLDGDGLPDPTLGAPFQDRGGANAGTIYGVTGAPRGDVGLAAATVAWTGVAANDNARLPASAGDLDGDGIEDLLVGALYADAGGADSGAVYVVYGPATAGGSLAAADAVLAGGAAGDRAGLSAASIGDFNGDGHGDLAIGAYAASSEQGHAALFLGPLAGTLSLLDAQITWTGEAAGDQAGWSVAAGGDLDGDGLDDVLVSARKADGEAGAVYGLLGGGL